jgi:cytochrome c oxidase accessory protein FixG
VSAAGARGYFSRHVKVHPRIVDGRFARLRIAALVATLGVLYGVPWLTWGDRPAIWLDLPHRKFHFFGLVLWPQDLIYLTALLVSAALFLFLATALAGRIWCGYACPQTVFTQILVWIERLFEGDRARQLRLARGGWTVERAGRQGAKLLFWLFVALWTSISALGWFVPIRRLLPELATGAAHPATYFFTALSTVAILLFAGKMREQVCIYMCPYARFQSAMFDKDTLIISYDLGRGEPRGPLGRGANGGDCVDCTLCVQVCPMGIDIRDGLQYQCIACAACIDACAPVMARIGRPGGLVRYTTLASLEGLPARLARPRVLIYSTLISAVVLALTVALVRRVPLELDVLRDRTASYRESGDGEIENVYRLRVLNMDQRDHAYRLAVDGPEGASVDYRAEDLAVAAGEIRDVAVRVRIPPESLRERSTEIELELEAVDDERIAVREGSRFLGPRREREGDRS